MHGCVCRCRYGDSLREGWALTRGFHGKGNLLSVNLRTRDREFLCLAHIGAVAVLHHRRIEGLPLSVGKGCSFFDTRIGLENAWCAFRRPAVMLIFGASHGQSSC